MSFEIEDSKPSSTTRCHSHSNHSNVRFKIEDIVILPQPDDTPIPTIATPFEISEPSSLVTRTEEVEILLCKNVSVC
jgi:hypothetical protein